MDVLAPLLHFAGGSVIAPLFNWLGKRADNKHESRWSAKVG